MGCSVLGVIKLGYVATFSAISGFVRIERPRLFANTDDVYAHNFVVAFVLQEGG